MILCLQILNILRSNVIQNFNYLNGERLYDLRCAIHQLLHNRHVFIVFNEDGHFFLLVHLQPINKPLLLTVHSSAIYTYSTSKNFQQFFACKKPIYYTAFLYNYSICYMVMDGSSVAKVLCYKSGGRWFYPGLCHWNFSLT